MRPRDVVDLLLLAALWGGSFLFMRQAAPAFGAVPLIWLRVAVASTCLLPLLVQRGQVGALRERLGAIALMSVLNSALPFVLIAWALQSVTAGLASILNASVPIFAALVGAAWLGERLVARRWLGLALGLAGVVVLAADQADFKPGGSGWAVLAMLGAGLSYGVAANHTKRYLGGVPAIVNAAGSQIVSALLLAPLAWWAWPVQTPAPAAWVSAAVLGVACTALAYVLFFRLIGRVGASRTVTVTFLVPVFGTLWGVLFLNESISARMALGGGVILLGTSLATGLLDPARGLAAIRAAFRAALRSA